MDSRIKIGDPQLTVNHGGTGATSLTGAQRVTAPQLLLRCPVRLIMLLVGLMLIL